MNVYDFTAIHQRLTRLSHEGPPAAEDQGLLAAAVENHRHSFLLWHEEDLARRDDLPAERIREAKRAIDRHNQARNDAIEAIDAALLAELPPPDPTAPYHSERPGMMLDRLSILVLREYHLELLLREGHVDCGSPLPLWDEAGGRGSGKGDFVSGNGAAGPCGQPPLRGNPQSGRGLPQSKAEAVTRGDLEAKLRFVREQREVLTGCLEDLLHGPVRKRWFPFRACKLYNDPATNPQLRQGFEADPAGSGDNLPPFLDNREAHFEGGVPGTLDFESGLRRGFQMAAECRHAP